MALPQPTNLTPLQDRFVKEYLVDLNATQAAKRAGFSDPAYGRQLIGKPMVKIAIKRRQEITEERTGVTVNSVVNELTDLHAKALLKEEYGTCTRILELLGRHVGAWEKDNVQKGGKVQVVMNFQVPEKPEEPGIIEATVIKEP